MEWEKLWAINKRIIDPICPRYSAVKIEKASRIVIENGPKEPEVVTVPMNKLNLALGERPLWKSNNVLVDFIDADTLLKVGEKVTLMNWGNVLIKTKDVQPDGSYLMQGEFLPEDKDFKKTAKITWLADGTNLLVAELVEYDHLIKEKKVEEDVEFEDIVNVNSRFSAPYYVDSNIRTLNAGQFIQFERKGYYKIDTVTKEGDDFKYSFIYTPDGKAVGLASQGNLTTLNSDIKKETLEDKKTNKGKKKEEEKQGDVPEGEKTEKPEKKKKEKKIKEVTEQKTEQPAEQKVEQPVEQKVEQPVEQKVEQPVEEKKEQPTQNAEKTETTEAEK